MITPHTKPSGLRSPNPKTVAGGIDLHGMNGLGFGINGRLWNRPYHLKEEMTGLSAHVKRTCVEPLKGRQNENEPK